MPDKSVYIYEKLKNMIYIRFGKLSWQKKQNRHNVHVSVPVILIEEIKKILLSKLIPVAGVNLIYRSSACRRIGYCCTDLLICQKSCITVRKDKTAVLSSVFRITGIRIRSAAFLHTAFGKADRSIRRILWLIFSIIVSIRIRCKIFRKIRFNTASSCFRKYKEQNQTHKEKNISSTDSDNRGNQTR